MRSIQHDKIKEQVEIINQVHRGTYAYYGLGGNHRSLWAVHHHTSKYWYKMLKSRGRKKGMSWERFKKMKQYHPLQQPKLKCLLKEMDALAVL